MTPERSPRWMLLAASILLAAGFLLPALMILQILPSTFLLNFLAYGASFSGLILGFVGAVSLALKNRKP